MNELLIVSILLLMGAQFGIALTATVIVHPILLMAKKTTAIEVFKPFFDKTHIWVLILSIIVTLLALAYSILTENWWWFGTSMLMHLNGPYTIVYMMPLNRRLMDPDVDPTSDQTANDIKKWGTLHLVRTILNGVIFLAFIVLAVCTM
ncbi:DUF1772 domain-containing protein [Flavobacteriaceae bacterium]|jgi:hypothetical protein|nr:DUF1772 domain-containing protein [Flavobacteriaceae bacterium]MDA7724342.1 DUF1772 domain-containing protein [Flavobacteriaceae bacterium]MDA7727940.1 DUF1772 domain-containing protein [Flavobacteriaceae bacterium]MDB0004196.1 DUF1772 domain-containing protein [Flavobacteriaceae bacterium]